MNYKKVLGNATLFCDKSSEVYRPGMFICNSIMCTMHFYAIFHYYCVTYRYTINAIYTIIEYFSAPLLPGNPLKNKAQIGS